MCKQGVVFSGDVVVHNCSTESIAKVVREYEGVRRKRAIGDMVKALMIDAPQVVAAFGEDAAVIEHNGEALLLAADGIWSKLMEADPYWAGYCSVLVNIHDIAAMGGRPIAMVDVFSMSKSMIQEQVVKGMHDASAQFGVPIVGGHLHPDAPYSVIDVSILGSAQLDSIIYSHKAQDGDCIVAAIDLNGRVHPSCALNWDSVTMKSAAEVRAQIAVLEEIGKKHLATAGKDISNPGIIGTLGMLLEISGKGAEIDLGLIPKPDLAKNNMSFEQWVKMYPGMGFILTSRKEHVEELISIFARVGMTAKMIGTVDNEKTLRIRYDGNETQVFDFMQNGIMHLTEEDVACRQR
ncbi:methanogenesis marker 2 protein [Methanoregula sp.]|uniref:methanogenesis marker 2 protein n=1 Tax=Methanoregula sp. TaxID=2052170 RepID=UPI002371F36A|nr:methanogenesis marker 2 protein [Methanoregula sp.]MDD1685731.1 methanogenesis marker 2 protein [Methanoregula sp.]